MSTHTMNCDVFAERLSAYLEHDADDATRAAIERHAVTCVDCGAVLADLRTLRIDAANLPELAPSRDLWAGIAERIEAPVVPIGAPRSAPQSPFWSRRPIRVALFAASLAGAMGLGYIAAGVRRTDGAVGPIAAQLADSTPQFVQMPSAEVPAEAPSRSVAARQPAGAGAVGTSDAAAISGAAATPPVAGGSYGARLAVANLNADYDREIARLRVLIEQRRNQMDAVTVAVIEKNLQVIDVAISECKLAIARDPSSRFLIESLNHSLQTKMELMRTAAMLPSRT